MSRRGFTLVEVLVALVIFEVGLLGVVGTLVLASRTVARASLLERSAGHLESVLDSLAAESPATAGRRVVPGGTLSWTVSPDTSVEIRFRGDAGWPTVDVWTRMAGLPANE